MISAPTGLWCDYVLYVFRDSRYLSFRHGYAVPPPSSEGGSLFSLRGEVERHTGRSLQREFTSYHFPIHRRDTRPRVSAQRKFPRNVPSRYNVISNRRERPACRSATPRNAECFVEAKRQFPP